MTAETLGVRVKQLRTERGWTQARLADLSGLSHSALSKVENGHLSPTFETLLRIAEGLEIDLSRLLATSGPSARRTRRAVTRSGQGERHDSANYVYETLADELVNKRMIPLVAQVKAGSIETFGPMIAHPGEEMLYVLSGEIELYTEGYAPVRLGVGDCAYFDSPMRHACISRSENEARVLWVSTPD
ncbi:MAG: helix-turn-helix transcriptional regulator [Rubellimicrobium sp.]|nr:helix-turn-helix transcriptional regulator [Rubellimicrobium sp.]